MLDIKFIRENPELIKKAAQKKHINFDVENLIDIDNKRLEFLKVVEEMRARQNAASDNIVRIQDQKEKDKIIKEMKKLKEELSEKMRAAAEKLDALGRFL